MTFQARAVRVGGYFTAGLLVINALFADLGTTPSIIVSLCAGGAFTGSSLWFGRQYRLK